MAKGHDHHHKHDHSDMIRKFVWPTRAIDNNVQVNLANVLTFVKVDKPDVVNRRESFSIIFKGTEQLEWRYNDKTLRDLDYQELRDKISVPIS